MQVLHNILVVVGKGQFRELCCHVARDIFKEFKASALLHNQIIRSVTMSHKVDRADLICNTIWGLFNSIITISTT